jgi:hypothetical protein
MIKWPTAKGKTTYPKIQGDKQERPPVPCREQQKVKPHSVYLFSKKCAELE